MYEQIADILIPLAGAAGVAVIVVILLVTVVKRIGRGNRERKQQLEELNGSIREIRDTLQAMQSESVPDGEVPPPESPKTVVRIDNRVQVVTPGAAVAETTAPRKSQALAETQDVQDAQGFAEAPDDAMEELQEDGLETVEQILAEAAAEPASAEETAETGMPASRVKIPVPEQPLPASLSATMAPTEEGPKMPKYMDRHQGTDKNGRTFTADELRKQIR